MSSGQGRLEGKVALVTGGSRGYGAGIAEALAREGALVWITARAERELRQTADRIGARAMVADITVGADWDRVFASVMAEHGRLDILVNNAGAGVHIAPVAELSDDDVEQSLAVNLTGAILGCRRAAAVMLRQKSGTIVNIASVCATEAWPSWGPYSAAKAGLLQFTKCLYAELRQAGARATCIIPSWGPTDFARAANQKPFDAETAARCIQPLELGDVVAHTCSLPAHLVIPELVLLPLVQEIEPL
jgi:NAD(P)-dependent dehydrogenase (short-subunit alcohol dehydrogenase family)